MTDAFVIGHKRAHNFAAARAELKLTPQEQYAYKHHLGNLDRGGVPHEDGSLSSFLNITVGMDGKTYVLPTVWDNQIVSPEEAIQRARTGGIDKWPSYPSEEAAQARYDAIHKYMERDTERRLNANPIQQPAGHQNPGTLDAGP